MAGSANLPLAGVEAIVEGLSSFQGDVRSMNSALDSIRPRATLLQNVFSSAWETIKDFGREILNVAEYALGKLLADAIEFVITKVKELIGAVIDAGSEFQTLEIRLNRLNLNDIKRAQLEYADATAVAALQTKEQLKWLQQLAVITPYDAQDIANIYTLARGYSFTDDRARSLTQSVTNFAAGMGLGNTEIQRIMINFGQLMQQGKINSRELMDLARGAFVPVNDILTMAQKKMGLTNKEWMKMQKAGNLGADAVQAFIESFEELVADRFTGAAEDMARTWKGATDNVVDFFKSLLGMGVVRPVLDVLGGKLADLITSLTKGSNWDNLMKGAERVGKALSDLVGDFLGLLPSTDTLAQKIITGFDKIANWIETNREPIMTFFRDLGGIVGGVLDNIGKVFSLGKKPETQAQNFQYFPGQEALMPKTEQANPFGQGFLDAVQKVADFINNTLIPAFVKVQVWFEVNKPLIDEFWSTIWEIISEVISDIMGGPKKEGGKDVLTLITEFMKYVIDNKDAITKWVEVLWSVFIVWQVLSTVFSIVVGILIAVGGAILGVIGIVSALAAVLASPVVATIVLVIGVLGLLYAAFQTNFLGIRDSLSKLWTAIKGINWQELGMWILKGMAMGLSLATGTLVTAAVKAAMNAYNAVKAALGIKSPSVLFMNIGEMTMEGFAQGIENAAGLAVGAMQNAVGQVAMPAMSSMAAARAGGDTINNNRNMSLTVNSSASSESVIADFNMLESLVGA